MFEAIVLSGIVCAVAAAWGLEHRRWNGGVCRESGKSWRSFDSDSTGARGYTDGEGAYCWCSWPVDRAAQPSGESK